MLDDQGCPSKSIDLTILVPMFNEEDSLESFFERVLPVLDGLNRSFEILCVDDGSQDKTLEKLKEFRKRDPRIKMLSFARNFGKEMALTAGLRYSRGRAVIPMDADLQDPPELLCELVEKWDQGADVVVAVRRSRPDDSIFQRLSAAMFYRMFNWVASHRITENAGDFCLFDQRVVRQLNRIREKSRFMKGLFGWVGYHREYIFFDRPKRVSGSTKWNVWSLWNFALDGITSFSTLPLRVWSYVGVFIATLSLLYSVFLVVLVLVRGIDVPGYASLMVVVLFLGGIQLISLGVIGEYLGRIYIECKDRPEYLVRETWGLDHPAES